MVTSYARRSGSAMHPFSGSLSSPQLICSLCSPLFTAEFESRPVSKARLQRASSMSNIKQANASFNFALRGVLRGRFLQLSVLMMFASSLVHSDGVGLIYLTMAVWCYRSSRAKCRRYWVLISTVFLVLLFMQVRMSKMQSTS